MLADTPLRHRRQILRLKQFFARRECTLLLLDDRSGDDDLQLESIAHGVISLSLTMPPCGIARRQLNVQKLRGRKFREGFHDFLRRRRFEVVAAGSLAEAQAASARTDIDLIVSDLGLPDGTGCEVMDETAARPPCPPAPAEFFPSGSLLCSGQKAGLRFVCFTA